MLKVLIVDDELLMRKGIQSLIDWEKGGFEIVGEAQNGEEALTLIREKRPDIVFTDIVMPLKGGLPLMKEALLEFPHIQFVVLSCHNDYEYVREALTLGARDYILKLSMLPDDLTKILNKLSGELYAQRQTDIGADHKEELHEVLNAALFEGNTAAVRAAENCFKDQSYVVVYLRMYPDGRGRPNILGAGQFMRSNVLEEDSIVLQKDSSTTVVMTRSTFGRIKGACDRYASALSAQFHCRVMAGVSGTKIPKTSLNRLFEQSRHAYSRGFYEGYGVYDYESGYFSHALVGEDITAVINRVGVSLSDSDYEGTEAILNKLWEEIELKRLAPEETLVICFEIYLKYQKMVYEKINDKHFPIRKSGFQESMNALATFAEVREHLLSIAKNLASNFEFLKDRSANREIAAVMEYVSEHLARDISLKSAAAHVNLSESYLSHLFKREMKESFTDYLQKKRMEKARSLLRETKDSTSLIAVQCGYEDYSYFCRVFKKSTGQTPKEYRKST